MSVSSFSVYVPSSSTPLISYKRGAFHVRCGSSKANREKTRIKSEISTMYTKSCKEKLKGNLPEAVKICEKKGEALGFMITPNDWKMLLEKSEGGFVKDVYDKYVEAKLETTKSKKMKNKKKPAVDNKRSDGGGKGKAGKKGSDGGDMKDAEVNEDGTGEAGEKGSDVMI